jgi:glycosyltransferase involved in cell wall biosynthesis
MSRDGLLIRALNSVASQTLQPEAVLVHHDKELLGAGASRRRLLEQVQTQWVAWIDSDDEWLPQHLEKLWLVATSAEDIAYVYSWFFGPDPLGHFGIPFNPCTPHHTTMAIMARTDLSREASFCDTQEGPYSNEDWHHIVRFSELCCERDLRMVHLAERTWNYMQGAHNSSGRPGQGDA